MLASKDLKASATKQPHLIFISRLEVIAATTVITYQPIVVVFLLPLPTNDLPISTSI